MIDRNTLLNLRIVTDVFDYEFLDEELKLLYKSYELKFQELFKSKTEVFNIDNWHFYIKSGFEFNAFANRNKGYNLIGITNGYVIHSSKIFHKKYFNTNFPKLSESLHFDIANYLKNCSIEFTFAHEFQHILQFNSSNVQKNFTFNENSDSLVFSMQRHVWEFDADRFGSFDVLKYAHRVFHESKFQKKEILKNLIYLAVGSIIITRMLFYLGVVNENQTVNVQDFYTKKYSHPHPFIRIFNIIEYSVDNTNEFFPELKMEMQDMLNNTLSISKLFFDSFLPGQNPMRLFFDMLDIEKVNEYNQELYDFAIKDEAIRNLLIVRKISFN